MKGLLRSLWAIATLFLSLAAYLVSAGQYEADRAELRAARRGLFLREVREAEAEYKAGDSVAYEDVDGLIKDLRG